MAGQGLSWVPNPASTREEGSGATAGGEKRPSGAVGCRGRGPGGTVQPAHFFRFLTKSLGKGFPTQTIGIKVRPTNGGGTRIMKLAGVLLGAASLLAAGPGAAADRAEVVATYADIAAAGYADSLETARSGSARRWTR